jgi:CRISPR-associated endonuclease Csn1
MRHSIGLDIGIASIGWSIFNLERQYIEDLGVRTFTRAEHPKNGASLALPRRLARGARRRIRRRAHRIERIRSLIIRVGLLNEDEMNRLYTNVFEKDPYTLRLEGLDRLLVNEEWARVLIHIAKRRGFESNRKSESQDQQAEEKLLLNAVARNQNLMAEKGYRTIGEMFCKDDCFSGHKRNKGGDYSHTVARKLLKDEVRQLFTVQRAHGNKFAEVEFEAKYTEIFLSQRSIRSKVFVNSMVRQSRW